MAKSDISMDQIIREAEKEVKLICSTTGQAYIKVCNEDKATTVIAVESDAFEQWFRSYCYDNYEMILSSNGHAQAQAHMKMRAKQTQERVIFNKRICVRNDAVYYDLGRSDGKYLKITADEVKIVKNSNILFLHSNIFAPQVDPDTKNVRPRDVKHFIEEHFNFRSESDKILFAVFLVGCFFRKSISQPILEVYGQKASAKSTCLRRIQDLIDPHTVNPLFAMPKKINEVAMCLTSEYMTCFDNISYIPIDISDLLCRVTTGASMMQRQLFTNDTKLISEPDSIVCFNSTRQCIVRSDLADRAIFLELERIQPEQMQGDKELQKKWQHDLPAFFGALCLTVKAVLREQKTNTCPSPIRLVDFYELSVKAGRQFGYSEEQVHEAFIMNRKKINDAIVSENVLLMVLENFMSQKGNKDGIKAKVSEFYRDLKLYAMEECGIDGRSFPGAPEVMTRKLSENRSNLEDAGICYEIKKGKDARYIEVWLN